MPGTCFWGVLQSFAISKLLRITVLTLLFVSNSLLNTGLVSAINITLGHTHKEPPGVLEFEKYRLMALSLSGHDQLGQKDKSMTRIGVFGATKMGNLIHFRT